MYSSSEYNICHIELPKGKNDLKYQNAQQLINDWINKEVLIQEDKLTYYLYQQTFQLDDQLIKRKTIIGLLKIHAFEDQVIFPHENTMEGPKKDRYSLLDATQANISPIFCMFHDDNNSCSQLLQEYSETNSSLMAIDITGVQHDLWKINDIKSIKKISNSIDNKKIIILDGHHRYTTALNYKNNNHDKKYDYILTALVPDSDPGLKILPIHRMLNSKINIDIAVKILKDDFEIKQLDVNNTTIHNQYNIFVADDNDHGFLLTDGKKYYSCKMNQEKFDQLITQSFDINLNTYIVDHIAIAKILNETNQKYLPEDNVNFVTDFDEISSMFDKTNESLCFIVKPLPIETIINFTEQNMVMPHKTTYLYPKIGSGFVLNKFI